MAEVLVKSFSIEPYTLAAIDPLPVAGTDLVKRSGALLHCVFETPTRECIATGDLAPLPGFSPDRLADALTIAESSLSRWVDQTLPLIDFENGLSDLWEAFVEPVTDQPALSWALFQIAASVHECARGCSLEQVLGTKGAPPTPYFLAANHGKIKMRSSSDVPNERGVFRYDSNATLTLAEALELWSASDHIDVLYWEEPLQNVDELDAFRDQTGVAIGLDESLMLDDWRDLPGDVYVIKPTVLGWRRTRDVVHHATKLDKRLVISTAYESSIGRDFLKSFAHAIGGELGLGRPELFVDDFSESARVASH